MFRGDKDVPKEKLASQLATAARLRRSLDCHCRLLGCFVEVPSTLLNLCPTTIDLLQFAGELQAVLCSICKCMPTRESPSGTFLSPSFAGHRLLEAR